MLEANYMKAACGSTTCSKSLAYRVHIAIVVYITEVTKRCLHLQHCDNIAVRFWLTEIIVHS